MAISAEHRYKFLALHRQWWRLQRSEKILRETKNSKTKKRRQSIDFKRYKHAQQIKQLAFLRSINHLLLISGRDLLLTIRGGEIMLISWRHLLLISGGDLLLISGGAQNARERTHKRNIAAFMFTVAGEKKEYLYNVSALSQRTLKNYALWRKIQNTLNWDNVNSLWKKNSKVREYRP